MTATAENLELVPAYDRIALVDLSARFKQTFHSGEPSTAAERTMAELTSISADVEHMIICADAPPYKRAAVFPDYKAHREEPTQQEVYQKKLLGRLLKQRGWPVAKVDGYEADDVIATLARIYGQWCPEVLILGADKDLAQCITANVLQIVPASGERQTARRDIKGCKQKFKVLPEHMRLYQALCGDKEDNVPGVRGIGASGAATIVDQLVEAKLPVTPEGMVEFLAYAKEAPPRPWSLVADHWEQLRLSFVLVTLDTNVPLDADALLAKPTRPEPTLMPQPEETPAPANEVTEAEFDPISDNREEKPALPPKPAPVATEPAPAATAIVKVKEWGTVDGKLQPTDLQSAWQISKMLCASGQYGKKFGTAEAVFAVLMRGRELGISAGTALLGFHVIEGKPSASADLLRALAEGDPNCEYFMLVSSDDKHATWETKHKKHPRPKPFTYTIEQALLVPEYWKKDKWGNDPNWVKRPEDMLIKTAGSKLARLVYPRACLGLYCAEEMGLQTYEEAAA